MACFVVPAAEAVITTVAAKVLEKKESASESVQVSFNGVTTTEAVKIPFSRKLKWLNNLLWGGSALLAFEHVWHGEVTPWFPFLTATSNPVDAVEMLHEMATAGISMTALVTVVWLAMLGVAKIMEKNAIATAKTLPPAK